MKKRMQVTISEELKEKMDLAKDFYGGYSGLIEKAVEEFLTRPVEPFAEDIEAAESARTEDEWIDLDSLRKSISES
jgi:hypothetical protein